MGDTVREKIMQNIETTMDGISKANGYNNDIADVQRWRQGGNPRVNVPCIVINCGPEEKEQSQEPLTTCMLIVNIDVWIRHDEDDVPGSTDAILNSLLGDVEKALMVDITRGGYAVDTVSERNIPFAMDEGAPHAGITMDVGIHYRHKITDPETSG